MNIQTMLLHVGTVLQSFWLVMFITAFQWMCGLLDVCLQSSLPVSHYGLGDLI